MQVFDPNEMSKSAFGDVALADEQDMLYCWMMFFVDNYIFVGGTY